MNAPLRVPTKTRTPLISPPKSSAYENPYFVLSATLFILPSPVSKSLPIIPSMLTNTCMTFDINGEGPRITQFTCVAPPCGSTVNSATLCDSNGFRKSNWIDTFDALASKISILPAPTLLFPSHAYTAPFPALAPLKVFFIPESNFSHGDHDPH